MMTKSGRHYKPVMGVMHNGQPVTDGVQVLKILTAKKNAEIVTWPNGKVLFYYNVNTGDVVYPNDITYTYLLNNKPATALELIKKARTYGFSGNDTKGASSILLGKGFQVKKNPNPTHKIKGLENH